MRKKQPIPFEQKFPNADPLALRLLQKLLAFDPKDRPTAEEVCGCWRVLVSSLTICCCKFSFNYINDINSHCEFITLASFNLVCFRLLLILTLRGWQELRGSLHVNQLQRWSLNLRGEGSQKMIYKS